MKKTDLRQLAEAKLSKRKKSPATEVDSMRLIHELEVHQIELEMQNEELEQARVEAETVHRQYTDLYDFAPVGYFTLTRDGTIHMCNLTGANLLGAERRKLIKRRFGVFVSVELRPAFSAFLEKIFTTGKNEACEVTLLKEGRESCWVHLDAVCSEDRLECRVVMNDITERKKAEEKIRQLNATLEQRIEERTRELRDAQEQLVRQEKLAVMGELAGSVGHELRNPLSVISTAVYYLKMVQPDAEEEITQYLNMIGQEVWNSEKTINNLLDFGRTISADLETVPVFELVDQALKKFYPPASVTVTLDIPHDLPKVYVDVEQSKQIFGNLIINASQAMTATGGKLFIKAAVQDGMVRVDIHDTGVGIPMENMNKIFNPLFTTKSKGVGLGLALCVKLIEANAGRIEVESEVGKGSVFTVYMPVFENKKKRGLKSAFQFDNVLFRPLTCIRVIAAIILWH